MSNDHPKLELAAIAHLARLARLGASDAELGSFGDDLSQILAFVDRINAVETDGITPLAHPLDASQTLREDSVTETDQRERFLESAPLSERGLYLVPRVIE